MHLISIGCNFLIIYFLFPFFLNDLVFVIVMLMANCFITDYAIQITNIDEEFKK